MSYVPFVLLTLCCFSQVAEESQTPGVPPAQTEPAVPESLTAPSTESGETTAPPAAEEIQTVDSEVDKFLRENAKKIDKIPYVSGEIRQTIRLGAREIVSTGQYRKGPDFRMRLELDVDLGEAVGKRIHVCNGELGYRYEKLMEVESLQSFDVSVLAPLIERKEIPEPVREQLLSMIPFMRPGDMLRGYLRTTTFTDRKEDVLGTENPREVIVLQGHWRPELLQAISGNPNIPSIEELGQSIPQYTRVFLDRETGWPIRTEMFRKDKEAVYRPIFVIEFSELKFSEELPGSEFAFTIPQGVVPSDLTTTLANQLQNLPDREGVETEEAPAEGGVSPVIKPATTKSDKNEQ